MNQKQSGGQGSINLQGDEVSLHIHGSDLTAGQVVDLVLQLGRANLLEMQGEAKRIVEERLEEFTNAFVSTVHERNAEAMNAVRDPDVQYALLTAQRDFARSGEKQLGDTLVDLLVARCAEQTGSLRALALNAAVDAVGRLTSSQVNALTCFWMTTRVRSVATYTRESLAEWLRKNVVPFAGGLPTHDAAYEHLVYAGCAQVQVMEMSLGRAWGQTYPGLFARGISRAEIPMDLQDVEGIFVPCTDDPGLLQVRALNNDAVDLIVSQAGVPHLAESVRSLLTSGVHDEEKIEEIVLGLVPELTTMAERWKTTAIRLLALSTVGTVLAHANWTRVVGPSTSLSVWIPDEGEAPRGGPLDLK